ncbi:MAG: hypothetical protein ACOCP8_02350 [archaeon]
MTKSVIKPFTGNLIDKILIYEYTITKEKYKQILNIIEGPKPLIPNNKEYIV